MPVRLRAGGNGAFAGACVAVALCALWGSVASANAAVAHVVQPGETLWSISAANNLTTRTVAAFNGVSEDSLVSEGQTINVPTVDEGAVALQNAGITPGTETPVPTSAPAAPAAGGGVAHDVVSGESLSSVAAANGVTVEALASANGLAADAFLIEGQSISIPAATAVTGSTDGSGGVGHTVISGESLSSVATANGISIEELAAANGLAADAFLVEGQTISVPAGSGAPPGMASIPSPSGDLYLTPEAADSWNAMREDSLANHGVDLYPGGPASAYRTPEQQQELYDLYLSGQGAPANPPGTSTHETGVAVDVPEPMMRDVIDQIGGGYGWSGTIPSEWWHVQYGW